LQSTPGAWEYKLVSMGNPLEADVESRANALGKQGWDLAAIDAGVWIFKRPAPEGNPPVGALEAIIDETVVLAESASDESPVSLTSYSDAPEVTRAPATSNSTATGASVSASAWRPSVVALPTKIRANSDVHSVAPIYRNV